MHKFIYKLAKSNKRLSKDHYKLMIKNSNLIPNRTPIYAFKEAFHSKQTPHEYRAMLLSSLYYDRPNYKSLLATSSKIVTNVTNISFVVEKNPQSGRYFNLVGYKGLTVNYEGAQIRKPLDIKLPKDIKEHIKQWEPKAASQLLLEKGFRSSNIQFQKLTLSMENISRMLFDFAYITKQFVFMNDPRKKYNISPVKSLLKEWANAAYTGFFANSASLFKSHMEHMYREYTNYAPMFEKMGIDTLHLEVTFSNLHSYLEEYVAGNYNNNTLQEEDVLYDIHAQTAPFINALVDIGKQIESLDEYSPQILNIRADAVIPTYTPYKSNAKTVERSLDAVDSDEGITNKLKQFFTDLNK